MGNVATFIKGIMVQMDWVVIAFVIFVQLFYFFLLLVATLSLIHFRKLRYVQSIAELEKEEYMPPVSLIVPAFNEEEVIVDSVHGFLGLNYPNYNVIIVNDGSSDNTLEILKQTFDLIPIEAIFTANLKTKEVRSNYRSLRYPNLTVVDKENGGKADSINAGINVAQSPFFCVVDADSIIEKDALAKLIAPFISYQQEVVATGGIVLLSNGSKIKSGRLLEKKVPVKFWSRVQLSDYLRAFLIGRMAWDYLNSLLIIAGAFGMFKKSAVVEVGGYRTDTVGEDMEITVRLHRHSYENNKKWKISFVPDTACWTQVPAKREDLGKQRNRWHRGLLETLLRHRKMAFNPKYGLVGMIAIPYFIIIEIIGPILGLIGIFLLPISIMLGIFDFWLAVKIVLLLFIFNFVMSLTSLIIEGYLLKRYENVKTLLYVSIFSLLETLMLSILNVIWKFQALMQLQSKKSTWDKLKRERF
jgi:cellulose synthase/poly-beta-1,6-N-acetylglucosamine synthase-like glycosyltransferase